MGGTSEFDPYHKWLGIPPTERPVNHYRLLGLALFEDDADVITHAADRQMAHLKSFSAGPHASTSQQLLNELAEARLCLLSAEAKTAYDRQLRATLSPVPKQMASSPVESTPQIPSIKINAPPQSTPQRKGRRKVRVLTRLLNLAILVAMPAAVAYVLLVKFNPRYDFIGIFTPPAATAAKDPANSAQPGAQKTAPEQRPKPLTAQELPAVVPVTKKPLTTATAEKYPDNSAQRSEQKIADESSAQPFTDQDLPPLTSVTTNPLTTLVNPDSPANQNPTVEPELNLPPAGNWQPSTIIPDSQPPDLRHVVPDKEAQEKSLLLNPIYRARLERAHELPTPDKQAAMKALAEEVYAAHREEEDPPTRFVLLEKAIQIATESGDPTLTTQIIDDLVQQFKVDDRVLRATAVKAWSEQISKKYRGLEAQQMRGQLLPLILPLAERAESEHRYVGAAKLYELASKQAAGNRDRQRELRKLAGEARSKSKRHDAMMKLAEELEVPGADHSDQLLELGRYWCFEQGDWEQGLRYFAASSSEEISEIAQRDLDSQANLENAQSVGDRWWNLTPPPRFSKHKNHIKARAVHWYELAVDDRQGLAKNRLEKRIQEAGYVLDESGMIQEVAASSTPVSLRKGLVAYYPFDRDANDLSGNDRHASPQNNPEWIKDPERGMVTRLVGREFVGDSGSHFLLPDMPVNDWKAITMSIWLNEENMVRPDKFVGKQLGGESYINLGHQAGSGNNSFRFHSNGQPAGDPPEFRVDQIHWGPVWHYRNTWTHHVATFDVNGSKAYFNGVHVGTHEKPGHYASLVKNYVAGKNAIGRRWWSRGTSTRFTGKVDDVRIYNRALSAAEVKSLYDHEK